jgi:hypothetical protein
MAVCRETCHTARRAKIDLRAVLYDPAALLQQLIDVLSGTLFGVGMTIGVTSKE